MSWVGFSASGRTVLFALPTIIVFYLVVSCVIALGVVGASPSWAAESSIDGVRIWRSPDRTRVVLDLSAPAKFKYFSLVDPDRFVLDLTGVSNQVDFTAVKTEGTPVSGIRGGKRDNDRYRIVLDLAGKASPEVFALEANDRYGNRLVIDFYDGVKGDTSRDRPSAIKTVPDKDARRDIVIAIDAGHGGEDPGAIGPGGITEKRVVMDISRILKRHIDAMPGFRARLIRTGDYYVALRSRRERAREMKADAFISVHADAFTDRRVRGSSVYTLSADGASSASARFLATRENEADNIGGVPVPEDDMLAGVIWELSMGATMDSSASLGEKILEAMKPVARLHKATVEHAGFAVLKSPDMPSVLLETGFISNPSEARKLANRKHQDKLAKAVARGIEAYFRIYAVEGTEIYWQVKNGLVERSYTIKAGDTLSAVAVQHQVSTAKLKSYNKLKSDKIRVGQTLRIPPGKQ